MYRFFLIINSRPIFSAGYYCAPILLQFNFSFYVIRLSYLS